MSFLLDTNVVSEARKPACDPNVQAWLASVSGPDLYLSVLVIGEIRQGIERLRHRDPAQAAVYETWLSTLLRNYTDRITPVTAEVRGWTLVTRNTADLARAGVRLLNPFEPAA